MKKTLVIGASENPERYSNKAIKQLRAHGHEVLAVGLREGVVDGVKIEKGTPAYSGIDTITMYVGASSQPPLYNYLLSLNPRRIIFNPGAENPEFEKMAAAKKIETVEACTLVMLSVGNY